MQKKHKKIHIKIIMVLIYLITFVTMIVCNIQLQNKKDSFIKKSYSIPVGIFPGLNYNLRFWFAKLNSGELILGEYKYYQLCF